MAEQAPSGFKDLLSNMMKRRWYITALVLGGFMFIMAGMFLINGILMHKLVTRSWISTPT